MGTNKPQFRFALNLLAFGLLVFLLDQGVGRLLRFYYFRQSSGLLFRTTEAIEKTTAPLLIMGASRANHHYVPEIFEQAFGLDYYNAGRDGMPIEYHEAVLQLVLKRYRPSLVILDLSPSEFELAAVPGDRLVCLWPYVSRHPELKPFVKRRGISERIKFFSQIFPFNSNILTIAVGNMSFNKERKRDIKGYVPLNSFWSEPLGSPAPAAIERLDSESVESFRWFLTLASGRAVPLYVVVSPVFERWPQPVLTIKTAEAMCREARIPFLDYSQSEEFLKHPEYFRDTRHLNHQGATQFSRLLAGKISSFECRAER